jgi:HPt (histidine-containing phosphotransfer) domain-containing protein
MAELSQKARGHARTDGPVAMDAPPLAPADAAIDRAHLARMTHGERDLEREVLQLFAAQIDTLVGRMRTAAPASAAALAHTLAGSARSIGAWKVAAAAAVVEAAAASGDMPLSLGRLGAAAREAQLEIADIVRA